jgi:hypothetical protein
MNIQELANQVCGEIPEGHIITLSMENGSAWIELDGEDVDGWGESLEVQIKEALSKAKHSPSLPTEQSK